MISEAFLIDKEQLTPVRSIVRHPVWQLEGAFDRVNRIQGLPRIPRERSHCN